jgi:hypothetical protein
MENRRKFLDDFAKSKHFNPLDAEKWYSITQKEIYSHVSVVFYFLSSL